MKDSYGRSIDYMRVSVTDKCNLRCRYCMSDNTKKDSHILSYDEIINICTEAAALGISSIKITGGEPLVREGVTDLIKSLKSIKGIESVTLTTNGVLLEKYAEDIYRAGTDSVNISIDTLDRETYKSITGCDCLNNVLKGIDKLYAYGIPLRINTVLLKGINDNADILRLAKDRSIDVRFIEMMPIGEGKGFEPVLNSGIIKGEKLAEKGNGPAVYYAFEGYKGRVGLISPISAKFCESCNRIRLTSNGFLKGCLCYDEGVDLRNEKSIKAAIERVIKSKPKEHCFENRNKITEKKDMNEIGG